MELWSIFAWNTHMINSMPLHRILFAAGPMREVPYRHVPANRSWGRTCWLRCRMWPVLHAYPRTPRLLTGSYSAMTFDVRKQLDQRLNAQARPAGCNKLILNRNNQCAMPTDQRKNCPQMANGPPCHTHHLAAGWQGENPIRARDVVGMSLSSKIGALFTRDLSGGWLTDTWIKVREWRKIIFEPLE